MSKQNNKPIRHGEIILQPVDKLPKGKIKKEKNYIVGHSETGHHHVLESKTDYDVLIKGTEVFLQLFAPAELVHKKSVNQHKTLPVTKGIYRVGKKLEYNPFLGIMQRVWD